jgi:hypothetical protein
MRLYEMKYFCIVCFRKMFGGIHESKGNVVM